MLVATSFYIFWEVNELMKINRLIKTLGAATLALVIALTPLVLSG
ncbi:MAG: hypothetical protein PHE50_01640 [Dehalococcoidales bacterium]|nr:hypothetical protein [Dehalococcoidales bacterium]